MLKRNLFTQIQVREVVIYRSGQPGLPQETSLPYIFLSYVAHCDIEQTRVPYIKCKKKKGNAVATKTDHSFYLLILVHSSKATDVNVTKAYNLNGGQGGRSFPGRVLLLPPRLVAGT